MPEAASNVLLQYGAVGTIAVLAITALSWFVISQKKELKESNTKVISLFETTLRENIDAKTKQSEANVKQADALSELARAIKTLPCGNGMPCQTWDKSMVESVAKSHAHLNAISSGVRRSQG